MNTEQKIQNALKETARENISDRTNLWPRISSILATRGEILRPKKSFSLSLATVLIALILLSTAAYAFYRLMFDPGLQSVKQAGLVKDINKTAAPTVFAPVPNEFAAGSTQTKNGITVKLNWAYADESRLAFDLTVVGLKLPANVSYRDLVCNPQISTEEGVPITHVGPIDAKVLDDHPDKPIEFTYIAYQSVNAAQYPFLNLHLDLTIGPCHTNWNNTNTNIQKPTALPLIGNYSLNFKVPVQRGIVLSPSETIEKNGISIRLDTVNLSRSYTSVQMCYSPIILPGKSESIYIGGPMMLDLVTSIKINDQEPIALPQVTALTINQNDGCVVTGIPMPNMVDATKVTVTVEKVVSSPTAWDYLDANEQRDAQVALTKFGISVQFIENSKNYWKILSKPVGMTDSDVNAKVIEVMTKSVDGPWVFNVR